MGVSGAGGGVGGRRGELVGAQLGCSECRVVNRHKQQNAVTLHTTVTLQLAAPGKPRSH